MATSVVLVGFIIYQLSKQSSYTGTLPHFYYTNWKMRMSVVAMIYRLLIMVGRDTLFYVGRWSASYVQENLETPKRCPTCRAPFTGYIGCYPFCKMKHILYIARSVRIFGNVGK